MTKVGLQGASIMSPICEGVTTGVSKHVGVSLEIQLGLYARALDYAGEGSRSERGAPFRGEHERRFGLLCGVPVFVRRFAQCAGF